MARLIDADKLMKIWKWREDELRIVREQPTIDAIPVSWIIQWCAENLEYGTLTIEKMLEDWRKANVV